MQDEAGALPVDVVALCEIGKRFVPATRRKKPLKDVPHGGSGNRRGGEARIERRGLPNDGHFEGAPLLWRLASRLAGSCLGGYGRRRRGSQNCSCQC